MYKSQHSLREQEFLNKLVNENTKIQRQTEKLLQQKKMIERQLIQLDEDFEDNLSLIYEMRRRIEEKKSK